MKTEKTRLTCRLAINAIAMLLLLSPYAAAQKQAAPNQETFAAFWTRFKAALAKNDRQAIAAMTRHCKCGQTPFENDEQFLDEWYDTVRRNLSCLARSKPIAATQRKPQSYSVICRTDGDELVFKRIGGEWKFVNVNLAP